MDARLAKPSRQSGAMGYGLVVLGVAVATIAGAFVFQAYGFAPCELCLKERLPYYVGIAVAVATILTCSLGSRLAMQICFAALALVFLFSAGFGAYHAGVEWGFWKGPSDCTGTLDHAANNRDFLHQLQTFRAVRCDAVAIRILGLSLAGWNALISLTLTVVAVAGLRSASGRSA